jgi:hypothetical protein
MNDSRLSRLPYCQGHSLHCHFDCNSWTNLDLSYNKLGGKFFPTINDCLKHEINRLFGGQLLETSDIKVLGGNVFTRYLNSSAYVNSWDGGSDIVNVPLLHLPSLFFAPLFSSAFSPKWSNRPHSRHLIRYSLLLSPAAGRNTTISTSLPTSVICLLKSFGEVHWQPRPKLMFFSPAWTSWSRTWFLLS